MRGNDRLILIALPLVALAAAFWFLLISPKRDEASELQTQIETAQAEISAAEDQIAIAEQARDDYARNYGQLVKLGRAVPEDDDQSTLVYDMAEMGEANGLDFRGFVVVPGSGTEAVPAAPTPPPAEDSTEAPADTAVVEEGTAPATATEAAAAILPIGATIGPAGLPVTPYEFKYTGNFFDVADFFGDIDGTVTTTKSAEPVVHGRLMTIDGFSLKGDQLTGFPNVEANFAVTTYIVPPEQGIAGGATPAGPAPVAEGSPSTVSTTTETTSTTPTAAATAPGTP